MPSLAHDASGRGSGSVLWTRLVTAVLCSPAGEAYLYDGSLPRSQRRAYFVNSMPRSKIFLNTTDCVYEEGRSKGRKIHCELDSFPTTVVHRCINRGQEC